jgi:IS30 family transposase
MIRWFFPKRTHFGEVTDKDIQRAEDWINSYPRRVLGWRSADAAMRECLAQVA